MALAHPDSDLSLSVIVQAADIIRGLNAAKKPVVLDHMLEQYLRRDPRRIPQSFFAALDFLYAIGAIDTIGYHLQLIKSRTREIKRQDNYDLFGDNDAS